MPRHSFSFADILRSKFRVGSTRNRSRLRPVEPLEDRVTPVVTVTFAAGVLTFNSDGAGDTVLLQSTVNPADVQYNSGGIGLSTQVGVTQVVYNGNGGNDVFIVASPSGNIFAPVNGITYNGGGQAGDELDFVGGAATWTGTYNPTGLNSGSLTFTNTPGALTQAVSFTGVTILRSSMISSDLRVTTPGGNDTINVQKGPTLGSIGSVSQGPVLIDGGDRDDHGSSVGGGAGFSFSTSQNIDTGGWNLNANANINLSTTRPHVSISGTGNGTADFYRFTVGTAGSTAEFDIDGTNGWDSELFLFDAAGNVLAANDDNGGDTGSSSGLDSRFTFTFATTGTYYVGVAAFNSDGVTGGITGAMPGAGTVYTLQVSVANHPLVVGADPIAEVEPNHAAVVFPTSNIDGWKFIEQGVNFVNSNAFNAAPAKSVLAIGVTGSQAAAAINSVAAALGLTVTTVTGAAVSSVNFNNYRTLYIPSNAANTGGGISNADLSLLAARTIDIRDYVNSGGSIFALTEEGASSPFNWLQIPSAFTIQGFTTGGISNPLRKTPAAIAAGLTISDAELSNGVPYHNAFTGPIGFNNLQPFVLDTGPNNVVDGLDAKYGYGPPFGDDRVIALGLGAIKSAGLGGGGASTSVSFNGAFPEIFVNQTARITVDGAAGNDTYNVQYGGLTALVRIDDTGGGTDLANLYGNGVPEVFDVNFSTPDRVTDLDTTTSITETVDYTAALETLNVYGQDEAVQTADLFNVYPDTATAINIFGGNPVYPTSPGDTLQLTLIQVGNPSATVLNPSLTPPALPNGTLTSSSHKTVTWQSIETLPVPLGLGGGFDMGTAGSPVQPAFRRVTSADTFTGAMFAGIYGWQTSPYEFDRTGSPYWPTKSGLLYDPSSRLLTDGHWSGQGQNTFTVAVGTSQDTFVTLFFGDTYSAYSGIQVYFDGALQGTVDTTVDVLSTFSRRYTTNGTGRLDITVKMPFPSSYWILNAVDVRPVALAAPISIARQDGAPGTTAQLADGLTTDTYLVSGAQPGELLTVTSNLTTVTGPPLGSVTSADQDLYLSGIQVRADNFGVATFTLRRPTGTGPAVIHVGGAYGEANSNFDNTVGTTSTPTAKDFIQSYELPTYPLAPSSAIRRLDFNDGASPTAAGFVGVAAGSTYTSTAADALGWVGTSAGGFDRGTANPELRDGNWGYAGSPRDFQVDLKTAGTYFVTLTMGDPTAARDQMKVTVPVGTLVAPIDPTLVVPTGIGSPAGQSASVSFQVTTNAAGSFALRFDDTGGDPAWTVQGLEVRAARSALTLSLVSPATVPADGVTVATYKGTGAAPGAVVSVGTTFGTVVGASTTGIAGSFVPDQSGLFTGVQAVADATGAFYFQVVPLAASSNIAATVYASDVTGISAGTLAQTFTGVAAGPVSTAYRFDFNGGSADTLAGFTGVRGGDLFDSTKGYGWAAGVNEFERAAAAVQASTFSLYRDGVWGYGFNSGAFQVAVTKGGPAAARVYVGDSYSSYAVEVQAEGTATWTQVTPFANTFVTATVAGTDANSDGMFEVRVRASVPSSFWVVNGMDVANSVANLPAQAQQTTSAAAVTSARYDFGTGPVAAGFIGVNGSALAAPIPGYGWQAGVNEFDRGAVTSAVTQDLFRDAAWGYGTTAGVFRVAIPAGGTADARAYVGDWYAGWQGIEVRAEGGAWVPVGAINKDQYVAVPISGSDVNGDGWFDISVRNGDPNGVWVFNGVDVSPVGGLPPAAP